MESNLDAEAHFRWPNHESLLRCPRLRAEGDGSVEVAIQKQAGR
jgi:hypothetical protein